MSSKPTALVIGASRGIGLGLARKLSETHDTFGTVRSTLSTEVPFKTLKLDTTDQASIDAAVASVDKLDVLVVNAARGDEQPYLSISPEDLREYFETNLFGPFRVIRAFLPALQRGTKKQIIFISSLAGSGTFVGGNVNAPPEKRIATPIGPYPTTKAALNSLGIQLQYELSGQGFQTVLFHPGVVDTGMAAAILESFRAKGVPVLSVEESTTDIANVINSLKVGEEKVQFLSHDGSTLPW